MTTTGNYLRLAAVGLAALWVLAMPAVAQTAADTAPAATTEATTEAAPDLNETLDSRRAFTDGAAAWNKVCSRCHTVAGESNPLSVGPDLSVNEYDADTVKFFVRNGHLAMPAFPGSALDDATLDELAAYIATKVYKGEAQ